MSPILGSRSPTRSARQDLYESIFQDRVRNSCARSMGQGSLQDPCLRDPHKIKTSESLFIFVQDPCFRISTGSVSARPHLPVIYTRSMSPDACVRILCKTHTSGPSARSMSPDPLGDPCLWVHVLVSIFANALRDPCVRNYVSAPLPVDHYKTYRIFWIDPCLRILHKVRSTTFMFQDAVQDPCLRITRKNHVSGSSIQDGCLLRSISQHPCLWVRVHIQDQCFRILCKIHVSGPMCPHPL